MEHLIRVEDYYKPELMVHMPQEMFDLLDEAILRNRTTIVIKHKFFRGYLLRKGNNC